MQQLTSVDAQFLAAEDGCVHGHVTGLAIYERGLTAAAVHEVISRRLHLLEPFRRRIVRVPLDLDLPYWVDDPHFEVANHVHAHVLPEPGSDRELAALVGQLMSAPLDLDRPPWAVHVIDGLAGGRVAVATQVHHAASDGLAMAELFATWHDPTPTIRDLGDGALEPGRVPSRVEMLARGVTGIPRQPLRFARSLPRALPHLDQVVTLRALPGLSRGRLAPNTRTTGRISGERTIAFTLNPFSGMPSPCTSTFIRPMIGGSCGKASLKSCILIPVALRSN